MALFMDHALARRLERTEGAVSASFTRVRQRREPEVGTTWQEFDGTYAIFDGASSPFTQTFGLGLFAPIVHFMIERAGAPIATGSLGIHDGVALLAGASTVPAGRGLGAQGLLLGARLVEARRRGCEVAMMVATPGSTSQRNAERRGFRVAYSRTKWRLPRSAADSA